MLNPKSPQILLFAILSIWLFCSEFADSKEVSKPNLQLANNYNKNINLNEYFVSEKLDGVRAYFDGEKLISRQGNIINAPKWFIENFPNEHIEGELWIGRGKFDELSGIVRTEIPDDQEWKKVKFMLFDMPKHQGNFEQRLAQMKIIVAKSNSKYLQIIAQDEILSQKDLDKKLDEIVKSGGEGLMLHRKNSFYKASRNDDLLKLKTYEDEEAKVIGYIAGKGKFEGMMGALIVEDKNKTRFKIGSGFSDSIRKNPPKIGSLITYKFYGKTKNNKPRFASFVRIYNPI